MQNPPRQQATLKAPLFILPNQFILFGAGSSSAAALLTFQHLHWTEKLLCLIHRLPTFFANDQAASAIYEAVNYLINIAIAFISAMENTFAKKVADFTHLSISAKLRFWLTVRSQR